MNNELCAQVADESLWDDWLTDGVPDGLRVHAETCEACSDTLGELDELALGFEGLSIQTQAAVADLGVAEEVLAAIDVRRPRWFRVGVGLAAAAALLLGLRWATMMPEVATLNSRSARWHFASGSQGVNGKLQVDLPGRLETGRAIAQVELAQANIRLEPESKLGLSDSRTFGEFEGAMTFESQEALSISMSSVRLWGAGHIELAQGDTERGKMISKKSSIASVGLVVLIYAGWASLQSQDNKIEGKAPIGLAVHKDGKLSTFALPDTDKDRGPSDKAGSGVGAAAVAVVAVETDDQTADSSGAYWSEEDQAVRFALQGEVIDAASGKPVTDFVIKADAEKLQGYGAKHHERTISGAKDGRFRFDGLALGRWRVSAHAKAYAPVTQAVDLGDVGADPYVVLPLSSGARISGQVVDTQHQPVAEAKVGLRGCFGAKKALKAVCRIEITGTDGRFVLEGVPADQPFAVRAEHERLGSAVQPGLQRAEGQTEHVVLELSGRLRVFGQVTKGEAKAPVAGVRVVNADGKISTVTDAQGGYVLFMPLKNRPEVYVEMKNRNGQVVKFASYPERRSSEAVRWVKAQTHSAEVQKDFRLSMDKARLFGTIEDGSGRGLAGVELRLWNTTGWYRKRSHATFPERTVTDEKGGYSIEGVPIKAGYTMAYLDAQGRKVRLGYVNVAEEAEVQADFQLGKAKIRGRMVHADTGAAFRIASQACGASFGAQRLGEGRKYFVAPNCQSDGMFEFEDLAPGRYRLQAKMAWIKGPVEFEAREITVKAGEIVSDIDISVRGQEADEWRFRVLDERGSFVPSLYLRMLDKNRSYTSSLQLGADGTVQASISRTFEEVFIDAQGYMSEKVDLRGRAAGTIIELRLKRIKAGQ